MTEREVGQILKAIEKLQASVDENHLLLVGNGNQNAVLPRLQALEFIIRALKLLLPIVTALIIAGLMWAIFGSP